MTNFKRFLLLPAIAAVTIASTGFSSVAEANTFEISTATGLFTPTFRGDPNSTWVGWDTFDDGIDNDGNGVINDSTPEIGTDGGLFRTTNGEDHISGSLNYYSGGGSVAEEVSFTVDNGGNSGGFTTVIVQGITAFGPFGTDVAFGPIDSYAPTKVVTSTNAAGNGQVFAKYEVPGTPASALFSLTSSPSSSQSYGQFVVDALWSPTGYALDNAIVPEPTSALLGLLGFVGFAAALRRTRKS